MEPVCWIIGVLDDGLASLPTASRQILPQAQTVIGSQRLLELVAPLLSPGVRTVAIQRPAEEAPRLVAEAWQRGEQVAALSTGDPLFFGMGSLLLKHFPTSRLHILPNLSYLQIALARLHLSGEEAIKLSVHRGASGPWQPGAGPDHALYPFIRQLSHHRPLAILTSPANSPGLLAHALQSEGLAASWRLSVCEQLCRPEEKISRHLTMEQVMAGDWSFPNVVVAHPLDTPPLFPLFGQDEALFHHGEGRILVTRREIRAVALAQMALTGKEIIWDIGAGSGSVALEAARLCPQGWVYAVEKRAEGVGQIEANRRRMGILNLTIHHQKAPDGLDSLPDPDVIFIGGSCGNLDALIRLAMVRLHPQGRLVLNFVTLENLAVAMTTLNKISAPWQAVQIHADRNSTIKGMNRLEGSSPVWILTSQRNAP